MSGGICGRLPHTNEAGEPPDSGRHQSPSKMRAAIGHRPHLFGADCRSYLKVVKVIIEPDGIYISILIRRCHPRMAAEVVPAWMQNTVRTHCYSGVVADENSLEDALCHRAGPNELDLRIGRAGSYTMYPRGAQF